MKRTEVSVRKVSVDSFEEAQNVVYGYLERWNAEHRSDCPMFEDPSWETDCACGLLTGAHSAAILIEELATIFGKEAKS